MNDKILSQFIPLESIKSFEKIFSVILLFIIFISIGLTVFQQKDKYFTSNYWERYPKLEKVYLSSQYVNKQPKGWIPDEVVNAYAGGALIRGTNPIYIIPDTPPLGKYLIGLSALIFNNENIVILLSALVSLFFLYLLGIQLFKSSFLALFVPVFVATEPIFRNQLIFSPLYDVMQLVFLLAGFYFFNKALLSKKYVLNLLIAGLMLGCFISTKFFATGLTIGAAYTIILFIHTRFSAVIPFLGGVGVSIGVLLLSYIQAFVLNPNLREFLGIQKWVFLYHKSQLILPFSIWPLILLNKWYVWFGDKPVISDSQWAITWPIITIGSFVTLGFYIFRKFPRSVPLEVLMAWIVFYFLFFSFGQITSRYFVILIPVLYLVTFYGLVRAVSYLLTRLSPRQ